MFWNKKKEPVGYVLKLFKIINSDDLKLYDSNLLKKNIELIVLHLFGNDYTKFNYVEKNYSSKSWKNINSFFNHIDKSINKDIVYLSIGHEFNSIMYSNSLLNQKNPEGSDLIEFYICSKLNFTEENIKLFVYNLCKSFQIDYGYFIKLEKNMNIISERKDKTTIFGTTSSVTNEDLENRKKMLNIKNGYFPKLFDLNILNNSQFENLNIQDLKSYNIFKIDENLIILTIK
jgi:hypothetical protein